MDNLYAATETDRNRDAPRYPSDLEEDSECERRIEEIQSVNCTRGNWFTRLFADVDDGDCLFQKKLEATHACRNPYALLLADSWGGHSGARINDEMRIAGMKPLTIPPHTTGELQPLDVGFFLQLKKFIRRITEEALVDDRVGEISSREGILNLMSLIYNQLQSPAYRDLLRYAWRHTDPAFNETEVSNVPPATVQSIQFGFDAAERCSVDNCTEHVVTRCSHCGEPICLTHFLERRHFHEVNNEDEPLDNDAVFGPEPMDVDELDDEDEDIFFLIDSYPARASPAPTSSTTPDPLMELNLGSCECSY